MRIIRNLFSLRCAFEFGKMRDFPEHFDKLNYHFRISLILINSIKISKWELDERRYSWYEDLIMIIFHKLISLIFVFEKSVKRIKILHNNDENHRRIILYCFEKLFVYFDAIFKKLFFHLSHLHINYYKNSIRIVSLLKKLIFFSLKFYETLVCSSVINIH